jgi:DNA primase catalytic core
VGLCPFHEEKTPSFTVTPAKGLWHCFGCNEGGDAIRFVERFEKLGFREAVATLTTDAAPGKAPAAARPASSPAAPALTPAQRVKLLTRVAAFYHRTFLEAPEGLHYLQATRGIRDAALFKSFQVGLANGRLMDVLPNDAQSVAELIALGVLTDAGREFFKGCVVFPLVSAEGAIVNLYGRRLADGEVNHLYLPGERQGLWNPAACKRSSSILVTESVIDALTAIDRGLTECMPCYGSNGLTAEHLRHFERCGIKHIALAFDGDDAGRTGMDKTAVQLTEKGLAVATVTLPEGEDVNSYLTGRHAEEAKAAFQAKVGEAFASLVSHDAAGNVPAVSVPGKRFERTAYGFKLAVHGRVYEVKGIAREKTQLKVTIKAAGDPAKGFELTTLDFYSARSRDAYARACTALFGEPESVIKADLVCVLEYVEAWQPEGSSSNEGPAASPEDEARAKAFLANPDLFAEILADLNTLGLAGEETNKLLCYLACVSRKLDDPLSLLIQSRSAAGKSTLQHAILSLCPAEDQVHYTRLTSQALYYQEEMRLAHKVLALEETQGLGEAAYSLRALQSAKKLTVATTTKDPITGKMKTDLYSVQGPVAVLLTTTSASLDEETASRFLTLTIDESEAMTQTILASQRHRDTLEGYLSELDREFVVAKHHAAQRMLEPLVVLNPYAEQLSFPAQSLRARRDHKKYLMLIKSIAFLYQKQRKVMEAERGGSRFRYIEATREDIRRANEIAGRVLGASLDELSAPARSLLRHIHAMVKGHCEAHNVTPRQYVFTRKDVREAIGWSDWQIRTHAKELEELEYLKTRSGTWGREYVYELAWEGAEEDGARAIVLADPDRLAEPA